jgi:putative transposase
MSPQHPIIPNAMYFLTVVTAGRARFFDNRQNVELLLSSLREAKRLHPFRMVAYVILPDHLHLLIVPEANTNVEIILSSTKAMYTRDFKQQNGITGRVHVWQQGFYDHIIRDETDYQRHLDYIHMNPVNHGYTTRPENWEYSSFKTWRDRGVYPELWGWPMSSVFGSGNANALDSALE